MNLASRKYVSDDISSRRGEPGASSIITTSVTSSPLRTVDPTSTGGIVQPVIFVKLGPTVDGNVPFCWSVVGETDGDVTIAYPGGLHLPHVVEKMNIPIPFENIGNNTRRHLRAFTITEPNHQQQEPTPTAQPTFLEGPRKYVHSGHPECFNFGWETMPPPSVDNIHA